MLLFNKLMTPERQIPQTPSAMPGTTKKPAKSPFNKGYFCLGILLLTVFVIQEVVQLNWPWLSQWQANDVYKQLSGFLLVVFLVLQWRCSMLRNQGLTQKASRLLHQHKLLGALAPVFFYAHAQHLGYAYLQALSVTFFGIFITGLCNVEIIGIFRTWFRQLWIICHVGLATALLFLLAYHVYISYAYQ